MGNCGDKAELDHGITVVGAAKEGGVPYWIARNSWGASWGQSGYVYIKRDTAKGHGLLMKKSRLNGRNSHVFVSA